MWQDDSLHFWRCNACWYFAKATMHLQEAVPDDDGPSMDVEYCRVALHRIRQAKYALQCAEASVYNVKLKLEEEQQCE